MRILLVDDEKMSHQLVSAVVRVMGDLEIDTALDGFEALEKATAAPPDLIVSDINMPDMDGLMLCQKLRAHPRLAQVPILLLTARGEMQDKYEGFLQGADDYMVKPFDIMELQLRIKALLRRSVQASSGGWGAEKPLEASGLRLDEKRLLATLAGQTVKLTTTEFALMRHLVEHAGRLVTPEALLVQALGYPSRVGSPQTIHSHVRNIRNKFRSAGAPLDALTSSWQGYLLAEAPDGG